MLNFISVVIPNIIKKQDKIRAFTSGTLNEIQCLQHFESLFTNSCCLCNDRDIAYISNWYVNTYECILYSTALVTILVVLLV